MKNVALLLISFTIFLTGCEDPSANKPKPQTSEPSNAVAANSSASTLTAAAIFFPISPHNSKIEFTGSKVTGSHEGGFTQFSGSIDLVNDKPEESKVNVDIET